MNTFKILWKMEHLLQKEPMLYSILFQIHSISLSWSKGLVDSKLLSTHARSYFSFLPGRIRSNEANHRSLMEEREKVKRDLEVSLNFSYYFLHLQ